MARFWYALSCQQVLQSSDKVVCTAIDTCRTHTGVTNACHELVWLAHMHALCVKCMCMCSAALTTSSVNHTSSSLAAIKVAKCRH